MLNPPQSPSSPAPGDVDRRLTREQRERSSGRVISVSAHSAKVALNILKVCDFDQKLWSVGDLITIYGPHSRVICLVQDMRAASETWDLNGDNMLIATTDLLGEIVDDDGRPKFRRGIAFFPPIGTQVNLIRMEDLAAIYDLGARQATIIGNLTQSEHIDATIDMETMLLRHFAVVGTTGVGKSSAVSILLKKAVAERSRLRVLVLDPHNEYSEAFHGVSTTISPGALEIPFWLFQFEELIEAIYRGGCPNDEAAVLREAINYAREMYAGGAERVSSVLKKSLRQASEVHLLSETRPYRMADVVAFIDQELGRLELRFPRSALRNVKSQIEVVSNDFSYRFMFGKAAIDGIVEPVLKAIFRFEDSARPITVLQLAGIPADVVNATVSVLARIAFDQSMIHCSRHDLLLLCEEAHRYVPADAALRFGPTRRALARIAKEGRKYGCCIGMVTQRPSELDATILSQCSTVFAMRLTNAEDQQIMAKAIPDNCAGVLDFISSLSVREAIAFGEAVATPMRMKFLKQQAKDLPHMSFDPSQHFDDLQGQLPNASEEAVKDWVYEAPRAETYLAEERVKPSPYGASRNTGNTPPVGVTPYIGKTTPADDLLLIDPKPAKPGFSVRDFRSNRFNGNKN